MSAATSPLPVAVNSSSSQSTQPTISTNKSTSQVGPSLGPGLGPGGPSSASTTTGTTKESVLEQYDLVISCRDLPNLDSFTSSDPQVIVYMSDGDPALYGPAPPPPQPPPPQPPPSEASSTTGLIIPDPAYTYWNAYAHIPFHEIGRTEMVKDNLNPDFFLTIRITGPRRQRGSEAATKSVLGSSSNAIIAAWNRRLVKFDVWDNDMYHKWNSYGDTPQKKFLGCAVTTLGDLIARANFQYVLPLVGVVSHGWKVTAHPYIILLLEPVLTTYQLVSMQWRAVNLRRKSFFFKLDPFLVISRALDAADHSRNQAVDAEHILPDGELERFTLVFRSEAKTRTSNPRWPPFTIPSSILCKNDLNRLLKFEVMDLSFSGNHQVIGYCFVTLNEILKKCQKFATNTSQESAGSGSGSGGSAQELFGCSLELIHPIRGPETLCGHLQLEYIQVANHQQSKKSPAKKVPIQDLHQ